MIRGAMAVAAVGTIVSERAEYARDARIMRLLALVVDALLFSLVAAVVNMAYGVTVVTAGSPPITVGGGSGFYSTETTIGWFGIAMVGLLYFTIPEAMFGATPGKLWYRLRVVRLDGKPLGLREVLIRNVLRIVDALPGLYLVGGLSVLATRGSQRLGDLAAGTTVVYRHRALEPGATRRAGRTAARALVISLAAALAFSAAFAYFGRPPLVIAGLYNTHQLFQPDVVSYSLGAARWGSGEVTYPITVQRPSTTCTGSMTLRWSGLMGGWQMSGATYTCP
jgi:uncharacterized RDD family membrane protein YckC